MKKLYEKKKGEGVGMSTYQKGTSVIDPKKNPFNNTDKKLITNCESISQICKN
jgi:hypothetical protein